MIKLDRKELETTIQERANSVIDTYSLNSSLLRFNRRYIGISDIENQYYCERKVHLSYSKDIKTEIYNIQLKSTDHQTVQEQQLIQDLIKARIREDLGTLGHETVSTLDNILPEVKVASVFSGVMIVGRIDGINLNSLNNILVIERKFRDTNSIPRNIYSNGILVHEAKPYPEHSTQARVYCYCLKSLLSSTIYKDIPVSYSVCYYSMDKKKGFSSLLDKPLQEYTYLYDMHEQAHVVDELNFAIGYWQMKRDSKPCSKKAYKKGLDCEYKLFCNECGWRWMKKEQNYGVDGN